MANHLAKQSRPDWPLNDFFFQLLPDNPILCCVSTLQNKIDQTKQFREVKDRVHKDSLFISTTGGHNSVTSATIAR